MSLQIAYWASNVSGGLVISQLPQRTGWSFEDNRRYAQIVEGFGSSIQTAGAASPERKGMWAKSIW
jgi:hypothetical protein